jgi:hypothetical protein
VLGEKEIDVMGGNLFIEADLQRDDQLILQHFISAWLHSPMCPEFHKNVNFVPKINEVKKCKSTYFSNFELYEDLVEEK